MSEPSQEPGRIRRMSNSVSRWRNTRRGTKTLKAAYALAARDSKAIVRQRIGSANLTKADLQKLAESQIAARFGGQEHRDLSQTLSQAAADRVPDGRANRFSRWRATRRGTKALTAAYAQAVKDVKKMDPAVRESIGRSRITREELAALSQGRMEDVFRPEGRMDATPGAQQPQGPGAPQPHQQPAQQEPLAEQLRAAQLQLQATMLQNQQFQLQLEAIQQQLLQTQLQTQQQLQALQQQLGEAQQAPAQGDVQNPDHVGRHAVVPDGQAPAQPPVDQRAAWVASGTGQATHQPAVRQPGPEGQQPAEQRAAASNEQWSPKPARGPDQSAATQADAKAKLTKEFAAAFDGQTPPRVSNGTQGRPAGERPAGTEHHRQTGPSTTRDLNHHER